MKSRAIALIAVLLLTACEEEGVPPAATATDVEALRTRLVAAEQKLSELQTRLNEQSAAQEAVSVAVEARLVREEDATTAVLARLVTEESATAAALARLGSLEEVSAATVDALAPVPQALRSLQARMADTDKKLAYVSMATVGGKPVMIFQGVNLQLKNTSGDAWTGDGTGNLILGPNPSGDPASVRTGSYNLVIGTYHSYTGVGSIVAGHDNKALANSSVVFGISNEVHAYAGKVLGGAQNQVHGTSGVVVGGSFNRLRSNVDSVIVGGSSNTIYGANGTILGGSLNNLSGSWGAIVGGYNNVIESTAQLGTIGGGTLNRVKNGTSSSTVGGGTGVAVYADGQFLP